MNSYDRASFLSSGGGGCVLADVEGAPAGPLQTQAGPDGLQALEKVVNVVLGVLGARRKAEALRAARDRRVIDGLGVYAVLVKEHLAGSLA
jgi:hypothetical protein